VLGELEMWERVDWVGQGRTVCVLPDAGEAACEKKRERKDPSTKARLSTGWTSSQCRSRRRYMDRRMVDDFANGVFAEGMRLQSERDNAHHVVLPAGRLVHDSPNGNP